MMNNIDASISNIETSINNLITKFRTNKYATIILILCVILCMILLISVIISYGSNENMTSVSSLQTWNQNKCYGIPKILEKMLQDNNIKRDSNWSVYFPCAYDDGDKEISNMPLKEGGKYFIIDGADEMVAKEWLWMHNVNHHGIDKAKTLMPTSYVLYNLNELKRFSNEFNKDKLYILKKNIQRQEGLKITNDPKEIMNASNDKYVLAQELLQDPYLISGRKINMRFYVLITCIRDNINIYVYNNGFMYYTRELFKKGTFDHEHNITTGYIDRQVYIDNPLTHEDFREYLDSNRELTRYESNIREQKMLLSQIAFTRIYKLLAEVFIAFIGKIGKKGKLYDNLTFQLFGVDIAINDQFNPMIIEINKGPDMDSKDERDGKVKYSVMRDIFSLVGVIDNGLNSSNGMSGTNGTNGMSGMSSTNGFIKILNVENGEVKIMY